MTKPSRESEAEKVVRLSDMRKYLKNGVEAPESPTLRNPDSVLFLKSPLKPAAKEEQDRPADYQTKPNGIHIAKGKQKSL